VAIPTPVDAKNYIAAAKKVYTKDTKADAARVQKKAGAGTKPVTTHKKWKPPSQNMYGLTTISADPYRHLPPHEERSIEMKLTATDAARRRKASAIWMNGKESGTQRDIYLRLYAADEKKYRK
jgi:hypothetical protein